MIFQVSYKHQLNILDQTRIDVIHLCAIQNIAEYISGYNANDLLTRVIRAPSISELLVINNQLNNGLYQDILKEVELKPNEIDVKNKVPGSNYKFIDAEVNKDTKDVIDDKDSKDAKVSDDLTVNKNTSGDKKDVVNKANDKDTKDTSQESKNTSNNGQDKSSSKSLSEKNKKKSPEKNNEPQPVKEAQHIEIETITSSKIIKNTRTRTVLINNLNQATHNSKGSKEIRVPIIHGKVYKIAQNITNKNFAESYEQCMNFIFHNLGSPKTHLYECRESANYTEINNLVDMVDSIKYTNKIDANHCDQIIGAIKIIELKLQSTIINLAILEHNLGCMGQARSQVFENNFNLFNTSIYQENLSIISKCQMMYQKLSTSLNQQIKNMESKFKYNEEQKVYNMSILLKIFQVDQVFDKLKTLKTLASWTAISIMMIAGMTCIVILMPIILLMFLIKQIVEVKQINELLNSIRETIANKSESYHNLCSKIISGNS